MTWPDLTSHMGEIAVIIVVVVMGIEAVLKRRRKG
jgi:hypothetical protein